MAKKSTRKPTKKARATARAKPRAKSAKSRSANSRQARPRKKAPAAGAAKWIVTASGDRPIADVAKDLAKAGLTGSTVLGAVGSITGSAPRGAVAKLKKVRGVADVSADAPISVGPPDSSDTW